MATFDSLRAKASNVLNDDKLKNEDDPKNEFCPKNDDNLWSADSLKNEDDPKNIKAINKYFNDTFNSYIILFVDIMATHPNLH